MVFAIMIIPWRGTQLWCPAMVAHEKDFLVILLSPSTLLFSDSATHPPYSKLKRIAVCHRVRQLAYVAYVRTPNFIGVHMILDMCMLTRTLIFSLFVKVFKFLWFPFSVSGS